MYFILIPMLMIMTIHFKTSNVKEVSITWGIVFFILLITSSGKILISGLGGISAYVVAWSVFSLANYFEESIFLRLFVLVFAMFALIELPLYLVDILGYAYQYIVGK